MQIRPARRSLSRQVSKCTLTHIFNFQSFAPTKLFCSFAAFNEMDENHDGAVSQSEFIEACMAQKKFSTMLTLKIIDVFIAEDISSNHQQQQRSSEEHQI